MLAADGVATLRIAAQVRVPPATVRAWRVRFAEEGLAKLGKVRAGRGRKSTIPQEKIDEIVHLTRHSTPEGQTHWSWDDGGEGGGVVGDRAAGVGRARFETAPGRDIKLSNDPKFEEKLIDVVGLYLSPPEKAIVLCMDEKSSVQALDQDPAVAADEAGAGADDDPRLQAQRHRHVVRGAGRADRQSYRAMPPRQAHTEFLKFLRTIDHEVPEELAVHLICDNYATHKHESVRAWLNKHPRFQLHFTPTSSSWLNLVERWFRELTDKALRRGVFHSVPDLIAKIEDYLAAHNNDPKPLVWTATADDILAKVARGRVALQAVNQ